MMILGIHDGHNASACLVNDGRMVECIQEERLEGREKNYQGFPARAVERLLDRVPSETIDAIGLGGYSYSRPLSRAEKVEFYRDHQPALPNRIRKRVLTIARRITRSVGVYKDLKIRRLKRRRAGLLLTQFEERELESKLIPVEHHRCHAAAAYHGGPWDDGEPVLVLTLDGAGDGLCATVSVGQGGSLERIASTPGGHSIGNIYARTTLVMGFIPFEHEYKLMGMAPYCDKDDAEVAKSVFAQYLKVDGLRFRRKIPESTQHITDRLRQDLSFLRFDWISRGLQDFTEELVCEWVRNAVAETGIPRVAAAGGVFMNVKMNQLVAGLDGIEDLFVFPSCGDESLSVGAAYSIQEMREPALDIPSIGPIYWGPTIDEADAAEALSESEFEWERCDDIESRVARLLADGCIVARCRSRMEFGARALGNRSIFADASRLDVVGVINSMIKQRDFWMPFAPIVLEEREDEYLVNPKSLRSPYMMLSFDTTDAHEELIAAVHPEDKTARPQILEKRHNPDCYRMMKEFERLTGRGVLLNTSFNLHGLPMVCSPRDALHVMKESSLRFLALGDFLVWK